MATGRSSLIALRAVCVLLSAHAIAQGSPEDALAIADKLFDRYEFPEALAQYEKILAAPGLPRDQLLRALVGDGLCAAALERSPRAVWAFTRVLALNPLWQEPAGL